MDTISAAEANRQFSSLLRRVREGRSFVVTSHGRPVARISPAQGDAVATVTARDVLLKRLKEARVVRGRRWTREELYERGEP